MNGRLHNAKRRYSFGLTPGFEWTGIPSALAATLNVVAGRERYPIADIDRGILMFRDAIQFFARAGIKMHVLLPKPEILT